MVGGSDELGVGFETNEAFGCHNALDPGELVREKGYEAAVRVEEELHNKVVSTRHEGDRLHVREVRYFLRLFGQLPRGGDVYAEPDDLPILKDLRIDQSLEGEYSLVPHSLNALPNHTLGDAELLGDGAIRNNTAAQEIDNLPVSLVRAVDNFFHATRMADSAPRGKGGWPASARRVGSAPRV